MKDTSKLPLKPTDFAISEDAELLRIHGTTKPRESQLSESWA